MQGTMDITEYSRICKDNYENIHNRYKHYWDEDNVSDMLAYCFQDERIFKYFLSTISEENNNAYCGKPESECNLKDLVDKLKFKKYHFPKVRVLTQTDGDVKKKIDILIDGKNFLCVIEVKFGSKEHNEQCQEYKKEISELCNGRDTLCIFLDAEHSSNKIDKNVFCKDKKYNGYYLTWFGKNVLPTIEYALNYLNLDNEFKTDVLMFYNFLKEAEFGGNDNLRIEIEQKRNNLISILDKVKRGTSLKRHYNKYSDELEIKDEKNKMSLNKSTYIELSLKSDEEIERILKEKISEQFKITFSPDLM